MLRGAPRDFYQDMQQKAKKRFRVFGDAKVNHGNLVQGHQLPQRFGTPYLHVCSFLQCINPTFQGRIPSCWEQTWNLVSRNQRHLGKILVWTWEPVSVILHFSEWAVAELLIAASCVSSSLTLADSSASWVGRLGVWFWESFLELRLKSVSLASRWFCEPPKACNKTLSASSK